MNISDIIHKTGFIIFLTVSFFPIKSFGQRQQFYFSNLRYEDGLPSNVTSSIVQDSAGFIWIGTEEGLCRYDGYSLLCFNKNNTSVELPSNRISSLLLDGDKIWVGSWNKLCTINTKTFAVETINTGELNVFRALYKDTNGYVWIGTNNGLLRYDKDKNEYHFYNSKNSKLSHNTIRSFCEDVNGNIWIGTFDGLNCFDGEDFKSYNLKGDYKPEISNNLILSIKNNLKSDSLLWVGTETGLCLFNTISGEYRNYNSENSAISNEVVKCIYVTNKELWLGTDYGLNVLNIESSQINSYYHNPNINYTISNNVIRQIYCDSNRLMWFITPNGVSRLDIKSSGFSLNEVFGYVKEQAAGNLIRDILITPDGTKWLASVHGVIREKKDGTIKTFSTESPQNERIIIDNVYALESDKWGRIWIGTAGGINIWDPYENTMYTITANKQNGLTSNYIGGFTLSEKGDVWVKAWEGGIFRITGDLKGLQNIKFIRITDNGEALTTFINGNLFFSDKNKLYKLDSITDHYSLVSEIQPNQSVKNIDAIKSDNKGRIWLARKDGLWHFNSKTGKMYKHAFTLANATVLSMEVDTLNNIWVSTHNAILKFNENGENIISLPLNTNTPVKSFLTGSSTVDFNGGIYFGGENGYVKIDPSLSYIDINKPLTHITGLQVNNQKIYPETHSTILDSDIAYVHHLQLSHNNNALNFQFSNLDYWLPEKSIFKYRLVGYDEGWQYTDGNKNFAIYSNLNPGDYTFELTSSNYNGISSEKTVRLSIQISPPIWLTNSFFVLYLILTIGILYFIFFIFNYRNQLNNKLKITQLEKEHAEQLFTAKQRFFTNISHEFRTPLSLIVPPIKQVLKTGSIDEDSKRMLTLANKNSHRLLTLVNQILDFRKLEITKLTLSKSKTNVNELCRSVFDSFSDMAKRNEIDYQLDQKDFPFFAYIDKAKIETVLFNLLSNAFKYTPVNGKICMKLWQENQQLKITISDSGKGISKEDSTHVFNRFYQVDKGENKIVGSGIGLTLSKEYANLHKGSIELKSQLNKGSCFTLILPFNADDSEMSDIIKTEEVTSEDKVKLKKEVNLKEKSSANDKKRILIVDDNSDILDFIEINLSEDYQITRAYDGKEGLELAIKSLPQLIVSDVMMPVMDGFTFCQELKNNDKVKHLPVILLTAKNLDTQKVEGMKSGADMYITKPFEIDYLVSCIESLFRREEYLLRYAKNMLSINPKEVIQPENNQDTIFLKRVMSLVEQNINNSEFSVELLSNELAMSSTHLYRKLKSLTGLSTQEVIKNYRLQKAAQMLQNKEGNITEVMYAVGFASLSTFSKSFKSQFHKSPSDYLKSINDFEAN